MAKETVVLLEDDIDGSEANETISFALDGSKYEVDLNEGHANELREVLSRFTSAGRQVSGGRGRGRSRSSQGGTDVKAVRMWLRTASR
ncbi:Lsr2 protein [Arthrobacter sp. AG258]|uniref:Lsr2 dimerization domain-containing protein n=1 Tax=Arthrobacter sp. AG258 TaxID=2183899 RepID=UPI0010CE4E10|nr:histone-like nucleoid-structuring protein Lsr2 [Arthrobacter sp. AG258]TDT74713.1 Lsr2 protein [Arthrobacter sp. AG258]